MNKRGGVKIRIITYANARQSIDFFALGDDTVSRVDMRHSRCSKRLIYLIMHCR